MIITGKNEEKISNLKKKLFMEFEMKDLDNLNYFLGIEVLRSSLGIFINQKKYVLDLLAKIKMLDCKPAGIIPIITNHGLQTVQNGVLADKDQYQKPMHIILLIQDFYTTYGFNINYACLRPYIN